MAPNCKSKLPISECAATFTDEPNEKTVPELSYEEAGTSSGYVSLRREETEDRDSNVRVTTASYSYELDRYHKNAMLIFHISSYEGSYSTVEEVRNTFEKFRFEIEIYNNVTGDELRSVCAQSVGPVDQFKNGIKWHSLTGLPGSDSSGPSSLRPQINVFSRDFTEYGAVAVVVLAPSDVHGSFLIPGGNFTDQDIRHHFNTSSATLLGKPKIFICQADNWLESSDHIAHPFYDLPVTADTLDMYYPAIIPQQGSTEADNWLSNLNGRAMQPDSDDVMEIYSRANIADSLESDAERLKHPLSWLCNSVEILGDREDMLTINYFCLAEIREHAIPRRFPFIYGSTLSKKLKLWRNV